MCVWDWEVASTEENITKKNKFKILNIVDWKLLKEEIKKYDILINATSLGLKNGEDFDFNFENTKNLKVDIGLGPSQELADLGNLYITNKANVHFRDKPHIGGSTLFLLPKGEPIAVEQVSKSLYFGTIEILVSSGNRVKMSGWLEREDTDLLFFDNIFNWYFIWYQNIKICKSKIFTSRNYHIFFGR